MSFTGEFCSRRAPGTAAVLDYVTLPKMEVVMPQRQFQYRPGWLKKFGLLLPIEDLLRTKADFQHVSLQQSFVVV